MDTAILEAAYETIQKTNFLVCSVCGQVSHSLYPPDPVLRTCLESMQYRGVIALCSQCVQDTALWNLDRWNLDRS